MRQDDVQIEPPTHEMWRLLHSPLHKNATSNVLGYHSHIQCGPTRRCGGAAKRQSVGPPFA